MQQEEELPRLRREERIDACKAGGSEDAHLGRYGDEGRPAVRGDSAAYHLAQDPGDGFAEAGGVLQQGRGEVDVSNATFLLPMKTLHI